MLYTCSTRCINPDTEQLWRRLRLIHAVQVPEEARILHVNGEENVTERKLCETRFSDAGRFPIWATTCTFLQRPEGDSSGSLKAVAGSGISTAKCPEQTAESVPGFSVFGSFGKA